MEGHAQVHDSCIGHIVGHLVRLRLLDKIAKKNVCGEVLTAEIDAFSVLNAVRGGSTGFCCQTCATARTVAHYGIKCLLVSALAIARFRQSVAVQLTLTSKCLRSSYYKTIGTACIP